jgi:hypothetical protein
MRPRFTLLPDERFAALAPRLAERIDSAANALDPATFPAAFDGLMRQLLADAVAAIGADEGTIWLVDAGEEHLVPVYNTGPSARQLVGGFEEPLTRGLVSLVYKNGHPIADNSVDQDSEHDRSLDDSLGLRTVAMIAVPFYVARRLRGVISCVQLKPAGSAEGDSVGFTPQHLQRIEWVAAVLTRLIDYALVGTTVGWLSA